MVGTAITVLLATLFAHLKLSDTIFQNYRTPYLGTVGFLTVLVIVAWSHLDEYCKPTVWILVIFIIMMPLHIIVGMYLL